MPQAIGGDTQREASFSNFGELTVRFWSELAF
jgi:hypothetical protein